MPRPSIIADENVSTVVLLDEKIYLWLVSSPVYGRNRFLYLLAVGVTIAAGLATRRFPAVVPAFLGKYPGDALWALMVFLGWGVVFPKISSARVAALALAVSYTVELLKFCQFPWLVCLRQSTLGHLVFGQIFSWQNLVAYTLGVALGFLGDYLSLRRRCHPGLRRSGTVDP